MNFQGKIQVLKFKSDQVEHETRKHLQKLLFNQSPEKHRLKEDQFQQ